MRHNPFPALASLVAISSVMAVSPATAQAQQINFSIQPMPLGDALKLYAIQSGDQILMPANLGASVRSAGAVGRLRREEALQHILKGTGFEAVRSDQGVISFRKSAGARPAAASESPATSATVLEEGTGKGLGDIVVTAQKRSESLQRSPAAITAIEGSAIAARGIADLRSIGSSIPSARFNVENNLAQVYIRGVGDGLDNPYIAEAVGMQIDGVYIPRWATGSGLFDVDRLEVLPGPQGTLYGRAAIGGVVNITTRRPTQDFEVSTSAEGGNYGTAHIFGAVNVPVNDQVSMRAAADYNYHDGYNSNGTDSRNSFGGRLSLLGKPNDDITIYLWGVYYENKSRLSPLFYVPGVGNPRNLPEFDSNQVFFYPPNGYPNALTYNRFKSYRFGGQIDLNLGAITVSYIPGYVWNREHSLRTINGFPQRTNIGGTQYSNEFRFSNTDKGQLNWLIGLYQFHNSDPYYWTFGRVVLPFGSFPAESGPWLAGNDFTSKDTQYAAYGQASYSLSDAVRLTVGGRYSWERLKTTDAKAFFPILPNFDQGTLTFNYSDSWSHFDWKLGVEADAGPQSLLYANVQTGFNPGTFGADPASAAQRLKGQKMLGFTVGSKNRFANDKLQANLELFYYRYTDQLINAFNAATGGFLVYNAPRSRMYGAQLDTAYAFSSQTRINFSASYLNARISKFNNGTVNLSGFTLPFSPKLTLIGGFEHSIPLNSGASIKFRADVAYNSGYWAVFDHTPDLRQDSYTKTDLSLTYYSPDEKFDIGVWARNVEDSEIIAAAAGNGRPHPFGGSAYLDAPRTYGVRVNVDF